MAITKKENGEFLGCCGFHGKGNPRTPELGIWIKKDAHGKKYGREAIKTLTSWVVENIDFDFIVLCWFYKILASDFKFKVKQRKLQTKF